MKIRRNRCFGRKPLGFLLALTTASVLIGCGEGYVGTEGAVLLPYLDPANLYELTQNPDPDIWIIDVRPYSAYLLGHIPTAKSFPSSEIASRLDELPKEKYLILECETGARAQAVIENVLEPNGYTRFMNWGGFYRWPYGFNTGPNP